MIGLLVPLYSGPNSDPIDWRDLVAMDRRIPIAVVINPNNGPGHHLYKDYLKPISAINGAGGVTLGYIPTRNGHMPIGKIRHEMKKYFDKYHVNGIFLDEMATHANKRNIKYYERIVKIAWHLHHGADIFANPGTSFPRKFLITGIDTFVEQESQANTVMNSQPEGWTLKAPKTTFAEISYDTPNGEMRTVEHALLKRHLSWMYITNGTGSNPYAKLPSYWGKEVKDIQSINQHGKIP